MCMYLSVVFVSGSHLLLLVSRVRAEHKNRHLLTLHAGLAYLVASWHDHGPSERARASETESKQESGRAETTWWVPHLQRQRHPFQQFACLLLMQISHIQSTPRRSDG